ncbi:lytic murein transglycosylase [Marinicauda salina]|uniref:peptidoglycan lytic exotransglycosylase n=1 Tax=Marinicauda salina TaxID=2135793 RepID=A0A2U2BWH1_9PROT|nr:MltA domain-containing protein [Marinicauda salina]PWE18368.1 lytic murein transglycosylase [Marinicauda salina]
MSPIPIRTGSSPRSSRSSLAALLCLVALSACTTAPPAAPPAPEPAAARLDLDRVDFAALPGWDGHDPRPALVALARSCARIDARPDAELLNPNAPWAGRAGDWREVCLQASMLQFADMTADGARAFFERTFTPFEISGTGRLTGYYEPTIPVRARPEDEFSMAIRARPDDLLTGDLGQFIAGLEGRRIVGYATERTFEPYRTRAEIEAQDLGVPLAWGRPVDVFFLQIQGSGRLVYPDGSQARAQFAAHNGRPYVSIGRVLIERGELSEHDASKDDIEAWLNARGPEAWTPLFNENPRYVFFNLEPLTDPDLGPLGGQGAPLTPMASLAVDPRHHAWGAPVYLSATLPGEPDWSGLVIAQDAGGAIEGPLRGDLFFGWGEEAGYRAGRQNATDARWRVFLPRPVAARLADSS